MPDVRRFLDAPLSGLHPPEALPGVAEAADLLLKAVREGRKIRVYGDYDVDGITGTALLKQVLHAAASRTGASAICVCWPPPKSPALRTSL